MKNIEQQTAKEILDYCIDYLWGRDEMTDEDFRKTTQYKDMIKEIEFMITTS